MKLNKNQHITKDGVVKKNPTNKKLKNDKVMMLKLRAFMKKVAKDHSSEAIFAINRTNKDLIEVRTDGFLHDNIYDPSMSEIPMLLQDASNEFGDKRKIKYNVYQYRESFDNVAKSHGWETENYGQGIIHLHRE